MTTTIQECAREKEPDKREKEPDKRGKEPDRHRKAAVACPTPRGGRLVTAFMARAARGKATAAAAAKALAFAGVDTNWPDRLWITCIMM